MNKFVDKKWKDISENDKKELLKIAIYRDNLVGSLLTNGDGMVCFSDTLAAMGTICDGIIQIDGNEVLYNP